MQSHHMLTADLEVDGTAPLFRTRQYRLERPKVTQMAELRLKSRFGQVNKDGTNAIATESAVRCNRVTFKEKTARRFTRQP